MTKQIIKKNITKQNMKNTNILHIETEQSNMIEANEENTTISKINSEEYKDKTVLGIDLTEEEILYLLINQKL